MHLCRRVNVNFHLYSSVSDQGTGYGFASPRLIASSPAIPQGARPPRLDRCGRVDAMDHAGLSAGADPQRLFQEAVTAQQQGDNATAARDYRELLRMHPEATDVRINLAATLANLGRFSEAIEQCSIVLAADPSNRMARVNLALAYRDNNDLANATKELERLHKEDPSDGKTAMLLADDLAQSGRYAEVISVLAALEPAARDSPDLEWLLGSAMIHAGRPGRGRRVWRE